MNDYRTEQEAFWAGDFGTDYARRNDGPAIVASNASLFARALRRAGRIESCLEFGANIGMNLQALHILFPSMRRSGIEINAQAADKLAALIGEENVHRGSILDYPVERQVELAFVKGVLIHIDPANLPLVYDKIYGASSRWILVCEYYSPVPVMVTYRGHENRLYKRDFAGDMLDRFSHLRLADYGFAYRRDPAFPQDDVTWFLLEKRGSQT
jgi:spore coat polysaccharide biosynthesis protein SpsF